LINEAYGTVFPPIPLSLAYFPPYFFFFSSVLFPGHKDVRNKVFYDSFPSGMNPPLIVDYFE